MKTQGEIEAAISENVSCSEQGCRVTQLARRRRSIHGLTAPENPARAGTGLTLTNRPLAREAAAPGGVGALVVSPD
jgi:hypothetical protein